MLDTVKTEARVNVKIQGMKLILDNRTCVAITSAVLNDMILVNGIRAIKSPDGTIFAAMPSRKARRVCEGCGWFGDFSDTFCRSCGVKQSVSPVPYENRYSDLVHPVCRHLREAINSAVRDEYLRLTDIVEV